MTQTAYSSKVAPTFCSEGKYVYISSVWVTLHDHKFSQHQLQFGDIR